MNKEDEILLREHTDRRLIMRLRIYVIVMLVILALITLEVIQNTLILPLVIVGILVGLLVGALVSRMYHLTWDEDTNNVIGRIDWIGAVILVFYLTFIMTRTYLLGYLIQGAPLLTLILSLTAGTMLGRVMSTRHGIDRILKAVKIID